MCAYTPHLLGRLTLTVRGRPRPARTEEELGRETAAENLAEEGEPRPLGRPARCPGRGDAVTTAFQSLRSGTKVQGARVLAAQLGRLPPPWLERRRTVTRGPMGLTGPGKRRSHARREEGRQGPGTLGTRFRGAFHSPRLGPGSAGSFSEYLLQEHRVGPSAWKRPQSGARRPDTSADGRASCCPSRYVTSLKSAASSLRSPPL